MKTKRKLRLNQPPEEYDHMATIKPGKEATDNASTMTRGLRTQRESGETNTEVLVVVNITSKFGVIPIIFMTVSLLLSNYPAAYVSFKRQKESLMDFR